MNKFMEKVGVSLASRVGWTLGIAALVFLIAWIGYAVIKGMAPRETVKAPVTKTKVISEDMSFYAGKEKVDGKIYREETLTGEVPAVIYCQSISYGLPWCRELAGSGYVAYCFDFGEGEKQRESQLEAVLKGIRDSRFVDKDKVFLLGESNGCLTAASVTFNNSGRIAGLMLVSPGFNPLEISRKARRYKGEILVLDGSLPQKDLLEEIKDFVRTH